MGNLASAMTFRSRLEKFSTDGQLKSFDALPAEPYKVVGQPGAFFIFTSNVDAHHYDWFFPHELRECHGNVELYQCAFGRARCGPGIWRAPMDFSFSVDPQSMLALAGPSGGDQSRDANPLMPTVGQVRGKLRSNTLRHMPESQTPSHLVTKSFSGSLVDALKFEAKCFELFDENGLWAWLMAHPQQLTV